MSKPGYKITQYLRQRGLLSAHPGSQWLDVEERTADLLMTYLACTIGATQALEMTPITDRAESLAVLTGSQAASSEVTRLEMTVLEGLLPAPAEGVAPEELVAFKQSHGDLLRSFRRELEKFAIDATMLAPELRDRKAALFADELQDQLAEISGRMRRRWPRIVFGTLCGVLAAAVPLASAAVGGAALAAVGAAPGLASAVYAAFGDTKDDWSGNSVAYAALARERFGDGG